jgi:chorismate-pyruvate lyase
MIITTLLDDLLRLEDSTTLFLESLNGSDLKVEISSQFEEKLNGTHFITRTTILFFRSPDRPALYCISYLDKDNLTDSEYLLLTGSTIPIGRLFMQLNHDHVIRKDNIAFSKETNEEIADRLNIPCSPLYRKEYDYWVGERRIGRIIEFFNEESLMRV